jgi:hypothetical protein
LSYEVERERIIQQLCSHYAADQLSTQELELKFEAVYRARTVAELQELVRNLPVLARETPPAPMAAVAAYPAPAAGQERRHLAIMSEFRRTGDWTPTRVTVVKALMASVRLDMREATFVAHEMEIDVTAVMSEVKIIVPPGVRVECDGFSFMGEFSGRHDGGFDASAPVLRVRGASIMAAVQVETRLPGESKLEAWRRRRRDTRR